MKKHIEQKRKSIPVEKFILVLAATFASYNFGLAGGYIEGTHFSIGGLIAGVVVNITIAVASSRMGGLKGKTRTRQAWMALIGLMSLSPILVAPVIYYSLPDTFLGGGWLRALWSVGWALAADLAIVLAGAVSGKGLVALSDAGATQSNAGAMESPKVQLQVQRSAKKSAKSATDSSDSDGLRRTYPRKCEHCEEMIRTPQSVGAHMKKHHPELCKPKALAVELFERSKVQG
ncbi:hypothetical protein FBQ81_03370 [Chloroflexi bacterium CFX6]|nr:hypothetical protein [Chloroflexi bacterium CFX6]